MGPETDISSWKANRIPRIYNKNRLKIGCKINRSCNLLPSSIIPTFFLLVWVTHWFPFLINAAGEQTMNSPMLWTVLETRNSCAGSSNNNAEPIPPIPNVLLLQTKHLYCSYLPLSCKLSLQLPCTLTAPPWILFFFLLLYIDTSSIVFPTSPAELCRSPSTVKLGICKEHAQALYSENLEIIKYSHPCRTLRSWAIHNVDNYKN